ncbi:nucleotidyltransferase domain-containing protein [Candidatus Woesearchaeota archaeon]|nr:nucleotidyltransferase domain-containing protein [Candidatus Woesearchaeota archaeon]
MRINKSDLISYASNFVSFLLKYEISNEINKIILFGSVATGSFDKESDIDLFIDIKEKNKNKIMKLLDLYYKSEDCEKYKLLDIKNDISLKIGNLDKWSNIKRSIISNGILLYGKYKDIPENLKQYTLFNIDSRKLDRNKKVKLWRLLYGYTQKIKKKEYKSKGLIKELHGKRLGFGFFVLPVESVQKLIDILNKNKVGYKISDMWSDNL